MNTGASLGSSRFIPVSHQCPASKSTMLLAGPWPAMSAGVRPSASMAAVLRNHSWQERCHTAIGPGGADRVEQPTGRVPMPQRVIAPGEQPLRAHRSGLVGGHQPPGSPRRECAAGKVSAGQHPVLVAITSVSSVVAPGSGAGAGRSGPAQITASAKVSSTVPASRRSSACPDGARSFDPPPRPRWPRGRPGPS